MSCCVRDLALLGMTDVVAVLKRRLGEAGARIALLVVVCCVPVSCNGRVGSGVAPGDTCTEGSACPVDGTCEGLSWPGTLVVPDWPAASDDCMVTSEHDPRAVYDDCRVAEGALGEEACGVARRGASVCVGSVEGGGRWTVTCLADADCPEGMLCVSSEGVGSVDERTVWCGHCERSCSGEGSPGECLRCDMECKVGLGVCAARFGHGPGEACVADCQCLPGVCVGGFCNLDVSIPPSGVCGPGGDCACEGGACVDGCCVLEDGSIARRDDAACVR